MAEEEYFDIFDAGLAPVAPFKMARRESHKTGAWHQTFDCWILRRDPSGDKIVLQLRSVQKEACPNKLDISACGHLLAGEKLGDGVREVEEELGLKVSFDTLYYLGIVKEIIDSPGRLVRHFCHTYFHETTLPLSAYQLQESEVDGVFEMNIADGIKLFSGAAASVEANGLVGNKPVTRPVTIADMASAEDRCNVTKYYLKVFTLAELYLKGHRPLAI